MLQWVITSIVPSHARGRELVHTEWFIEAPEYRVVVDHLGAPVKGPDGAPVISAGPVVRQTVLVHQVEVEESLTDDEVCAAVELERATIERILVAKADREAGGRRTSLRGRSGK